MAKDGIELTVSMSAIREAVKQQCSDPIIALSKNNAIMRQIANMAIILVDDYVPLEKGALRTSAHVTQHARSTKVVYGHPKIGKTSIYAPIQYDRDVLHPDWKYTTPGTMGDWFSILTPGHSEYYQLVEFATNLMRKAVKK